MQFKLVSVLALAALAAAGAIPQNVHGNNDTAPAGSDDTPGKNLPPPASPGLPPPPKPTSPPPPLPANIDFTQPHRRSANDTPNGANTVGAGDSKTADGAKTTNVNPPVSGKPLPIIPPSKCPSGGLRCCSDAQLSTTSGLAPLLKKYDISVEATNPSYIGTTCIDIPATGPCPTHPLCCSDVSHGGDIVAGCNQVQL